jgi:peptide/nickel transport system ATP-binding protein
MLAEMQVPDPERIMAAYPHQLSGGQQQRAVIAMALLPQPRLLLLDEPTTSLDVTIEAGIVDLLATLRRTHNTAMLFISHNLGLVGQICDRAAVMYAGEIVETGEVQRMFTQPRHPYTMGLVRCIPRPDLPRATQRLVPIPGQVSAPGERPTGCRFGPRCEHFSRRVCDQATILLEPIDPASAVRCARSATIAPLPMLENLAGAVDPRDQTLVAAERLDKFYPLRGPAKGHVVRANQGLTFTAARGQTLAIVGESGCGKSTFANVLMGLTAASGGKLWFETVDLARLPLDRRPAALLRDLQMVFQNPDETLNPSYPVGMQIARAVRRLGVARDRTSVQARVRSLLSMTRLPASYADRRPSQLSGGQKQRVGIARALAMKPDLLLFDEPTSALDPELVTEVLAVMRDLAREGRTMVIVTHEMGFAREAATRVLFLDRGRVVETGSPNAFFARPETERARQFLQRYAGETSAGRRSA